MTTLKDKPVRRKVETSFKPLIVSVYPNGLLGLRIARKRTEHTVPLSRCFRLACEISAERAKQEREAKRNAARAERGLPPLRKLVRRSVI